MKDALVETKTKYHKWLQDSAISGYYNTWELLRIINDNKYADACKNMIYLQSYNREDYKNYEDFWLNGIFDIDNDTLLFMLRKQVEEYIPLLQQQCDMALYNFIMNSQYSIEQISKMNEKIVINNEGHTIHLFKSE